MTVRLASCLVMSSIVALTAGCGGGRNPNAPANLSGKVTYKSNPVTAGMMIVHAKEGGSYPITITQDGTFSGVDLPKGEVTITIETESAKKKDIKYGVGQGGDKGKTFSPVPEGSKAVAPGAYVQIPAKYAEKSTSPLTITLEPGQNKKDFDLTD